MRYIVAQRVSSVHGCVETGDRTLSDMQIVRDQSPNSLFHSHHNISLQTVFSLPTHAFLESITSKNNALSVASASARAVFTRRTRSQHLAKTIRSGTLAPWPAERSSDDGFKASTVFVLGGGPAAACRRPGTKPPIHVQPFKLCPSSWTSPAVYFTD